MNMMDGINGLGAQRSIIVKGKFEDCDFDRLVIKTSQSVALRFSVVGLDEETNLLDSGSSKKQDSPDIIGDPQNQDQPKRPMNAFMVWAQAIRRELHDNFSNIQNALLSKALGRVWRSMDSKEREPFVKRACAIKIIHKRNYPNYRYQPRRTQERKAKSSLLVGISLDHPVNEPHLKRIYSAGDRLRQSFNEDQLVSADRQPRGRAHWPAEQPINYQNGTYRAGDHNDEVQTFRYHPYPTTQVAGDTSLAHGGQNYGNGSQSDHYLDTRHLPVQLRAHENYYNEQRHYYQQSSTRDNHAQLTISSYNNGFDTCTSSCYHDAGSRFN